MKHTERFEIKRAELFDDLVAVTAEFLRAHDVNEKAANIVANSLADHLADTWGGQNINIPKDYQRKLAARELELYQAFTGHNHGELARQFGMTERSVYKVLKRVRERLRRNAQGHPQLFETS